MLKKTLLVLIPLLFALACGFGGDTDSDSSSTGSGLQPPANAVEISIIYAPEEELYIVEAIEQFLRVNGERIGQ